jgi:hypothetical protein
MQIPNLDERMAQDLAGAQDQEITLLPIDH